MTYGEFIKKIRKEKLKWSALKLAERLEVAPGTVSRWENGHLIPEHENVLKILLMAKIKFEDCLKLPEDWLQEEVDVARMRRIAREVFHEEKSNSPPNKKSG